MFCDLELKSHEDQEYCFLHFDLSKGVMAPIAFSLSFWHLLMFRAE